MLSRYLMMAHWAVFAAGVFIVAASLLSMWQFLVMALGFGRDSTLHDTYLVSPDMTGFWNANAAVIACTALVCWALRWIVRRLENGE